MRTFREVFAGLRALQRPLPQSKVRPQRLFIAVEGFLLGLSEVGILQNSLKALLPEAIQVNFAEVTVLKQFNEVGVAARHNCPYGA